MGFREELCGCVSLRYFDFSKEPQSDPQSPEDAVSITLRSNDAILWGKTPVSLENFVGKLWDEVRYIGSDNLRVTVHVDADAGYAPLRCILEQLKRAGISKVMLKPL